MIFYIILSFTLLICINHLRIDATTTLNPNGTECEEMDKPGWSFFTLANKTLDTWPWSCLNIRYTESTLNEEILKLSSDIFEATRRDYIGYVQYYVERRRANLCDIPNPIYTAIAEGNLRIAQYMLTNDSILSCLETNQDSLSVTKFAAYYGELNILKFLLEEKNLKDYESNTEEFQSIAFAAGSKGHLHVLKYLVEEKSFIIKPDDGALLFTAAQAGKVDVLKYLLHKKDINAKELSDEDFHYDQSKYYMYKCGNLTLLCNVALGGKLDAVIFSVEILNSTEFFNYNDKWSEEHPLVAAVKGGSLPVIKYMIEEKNADLNSKFSNDSLLHIAAKYGQLLVVKYLVELRHMDVDSKNYVGATPLYGAIRQNRLGVAMYLAGDRNATLNVLPGSNALIEAARSTWRDSNSKIVQFLVDDMKMITRINEVDNSNETAVMKAAMYAELDVLRFLVDDRHADTTIMPPTNMTLLHFAARGILSSINNMPTLKYLIEEKDFKVSARTAKNETVLDMARNNRYIKVSPYLREKLEQELGKTAELKE